MCGRFYVDDATAREILKAIRKVDEELRKERAARKEDNMAGAAGLASSETCRAGEASGTDKAEKLDLVDDIERIGLTGDIHPTERALVIMADKTGQGDITNKQRRLAAAVKRWGFPGFDEGRSGGKILINARCETVLERKLFRESVQRRRIAIPATGFYEWNRNKEMATFTNKGKILYLAGFYNRFEDEDRFVILTTAANESMKEVHDRMPLILEEEELSDWLWEERKLEILLGKKPPQLQKIVEYEQTTLKFG